MEVDGANDIDFTEFAKLMAFAESPLTEVIDVTNISEESQKENI